MTNTLQAPFTLWLAARFGHELLALAFLPLQRPQSNPYLPPSPESMLPRFGHELLALAFLTLHSARLWSIPYLPPRSR